MSFAAEAIPATTTPRYIKVHTVGRLPAVAPQVISGISAAAVPHSEEVAHRVEAVAHQRVVPWGRQKANPAATQTRLEAGFVLGQAEQPCLAGCSR